MKDVLAVSREELRKREGEWKREHPKQKKNAKRIKA
jgi:hypothetical protein